MDRREALALVIAAVTSVIGIVLIVVAKRRRLTKRGSGNLRIDLNRDNRGESRGR